MIIGKYTLRGNTRSGRKPRRMITELTLGSGVGGGGLRARLTAESKLVSTHSISETYLDAH